MRTLFFYITLLFCVQHVCAQSTAKEFGQRLFDILKNDSLAVLPKYRLSETDLIGFLVSIKIDTATAQIKKYISKYLDITKAFFQKCANIETDSTKYPVWKDAELMEMHLKRNSTAEPDADESGSPPFYLYETIQCGTKKYRLQVEVLRYRGRWLLGNYIDCLLTDYDY